MRKWKTPNAEQNNTCRATRKGRNMCFNIDPKDQSNPSGHMLVLTRKQVAGSLTKSLNVRRWWPVHGRSHWLHSPSKRWWSQGPPRRGAHEPHPTGRARSHAHALQRIITGGRARGGEGRGCLQGSGGVSTLNNVKENRACFT